MGQYHAGEQEIQYLYIMENYSENYRRYGNQCFFTIETEPDEEGKYTIPSRIFIPKEYHGKKVDHKEIAWYEESFINKMIRKGHIYF